MSAQRLAPDYVDPRDLGPASLLADLVRAYLQEQQDNGRSERTVARYRGYLDELLTFLGPTASPRVADLDLRSIKAFGSHLTRRQLRGGRRAGKGAVSPATKNLYLIALRGLLKFGVLLDLPVPGPEKVKLAKATDPSPDARHLERSRLDRLIASFDTATDDGVRGRALVELLCATGCRISEVIGLDRAQLELDRSAKAPKDGIRIVDEVTVFGKGSRYRKVFLTPRAREWLQKHLQMRRDTDRALFVTDRKKADGYRMSVWTAQRTITEAAKRAGLAENVSPHWLRHAAITLWTTEMGLPAAQRLAGHKNASTTSRYLGGSDAELKELYKRRIG
ncbi:MAG TPA: tyrosine-type recombinase/integrase [Candidatus Limnocylindria bacterium]|nr:tyrosine-type recombinase/integrase [Candidatus Limnocylindria bacterium]